MARREARCRFCDAAVAICGLDTHEQWCDDNPNPGVRPGIQAFAVAVAAMALAVQGGIF